jgi:hypothetical protein
MSNSARRRERKDSQSLLAGFSKIIMTIYSKNKVLAERNNHGYEIFKGVYETNLILG